MLEKMGYEWNGAKWVRGDAAAYSRRKASARSSNRFIVFVDEKTGEANATPSAVIAAKRMSQVLLQARQNVIPTSVDSLARDRDFKSFAQKPEAPLLWMLSEVVAFGVLSSSFAIDWSQEIQNAIDSPVIIMLLGIPAGIGLSYSRATSRALAPGAEEVNGKLTRLFADVATEKDTIALPAAAHIRYANPRWKLYGFLGESISAINVAIVFNGVLQPTLSRVFDMDLAPFTDPSPYATAAAAAITAIPAALIVIKPSPIACDGIPAEVEAVERANATIGAYFNMQKFPPESSAIQASHRFQQMADGWISKFGGVPNGAEWKQPLLAYVGSLICACTYVATGCDLLAPILVRVVAAGDTYLIRDERESSQVKVLLTKEPE